MVTIDESRITIQPLNPQWYANKVAAIDMLRLDQIHPVISGNKWYKLKHNLAHALEGGFNGVLTFGGAYSNHLIATAAAANRYGLAPVGIIRGAYHADNLTPTLAACKELGMELIFITKEAYSKKNDPEWIKEISSQHPGYFIIPEGGANALGRKGASEIACFIDASYTHICLSVGTATTFTGLRNALPPEQQLLGFVPMKNGTYLEGEVNEHLASPGLKTSFTLFDTWHFGGFGKWNDELLAFMNRFKEMNKIPLDIVYTSKMMYGLDALLNNGFFPKGAEVLCIHTGGLQGNVS